MYSLAVFDAFWFTYILGLGANILVCFELSVSSRDWCLIYDFQVNRQIVIMALAPQILFIL